MTFTVESGGALIFQLKHRPQSGCTSAEYGKFTRAFIRYINPYLPQPYVGEDITEYLIDSMPSNLREAGRRTLAEAQA